MVFLLPAVIVADFLVYTRSAGRPGRLTLASLAGAVPLGLLILAWGGRLAPIPLSEFVGQTSRPVPWYLSEGPRYDLHALSLYLAVPGVYLLPLLILLPGKGAARQWLTASILATFVLWFAVQPSTVQARAGVHTVGFVHKALAATFPAPFVNGVFWIFATLWLKSLIDTFAVARRSWRTKGMTLADVFPWTGCLAFLVVMPFSYMPWEKYALPLFMLGSLPIAWRISTISTTSHWTDSPQLTGRSTDRPLHHSDTAHVRQGVPSASGAMGRDVACAAEWIGLAPPLPAVTSGNT